MSDTNVEMAGSQQKKKPTININGIEYSDVIDSLGKDIQDFRNDPKYGLAIGGI